MDAWDASLITLFLKHSSPQGSGLSLVESQGHSSEANSHQGFGKELEPAVAGRGTVMSQEQRKGPQFSTWEF